MELANCNLRFSFYLTIFAGYFDFIDYKYIYRVGQKSEATNLWP